MAHTRTSAAWTNHPETVLVIGTQEKNSVLIIIFTLTISCKGSIRLVLVVMSYSQAILAITELNTSSVYVKVGPVILVPAVLTGAAELGIDFVPRGS